MNLSPYRQTSLKAIGFRLAVTKLFLCLPFFVIAWSNINMAKLIVEKTFLELLYGDILILFMPILFNL